MVVVGVEVERVCRSRRCGAHGLQRGQVRLGRIENAVIVVVLVADVTSAVPSVDSSCRPVSPAGTAANCRRGSHRHSLAAGSSRPRNCRGPCNPIAIVPVERDVSHKVFVSPVTRSAEDDIIPRSARRRRPRAVTVSLPVGGESVGAHLARYVCDAVVCEHVASLRDSSRIQPDAGAAEHDRPCVAADLRLAEVLPSSRPEFTAYRNSRK